ncbi:MAG: hypothetical protein R3F49_01615 [Planctomycetota bacterium]
MQRIALPTLATLLLTTAALAFQERVSKPKAKDFGGILTEAKAAFDGQRYGAAVGGLRDAITIASKEHRKAIRAAFPTAPAGWALEAAEDDGEAPAQLASLALMAGTSVEGTYRQSSGRGKMQVTVLADSPMAQMFSMMTSNPALLDKESELVKYGQHSAVLRTRTKGSSYELQLLIVDDLVTVSVEGANDELLFAVWNQAAVDKLAAALSL